MDLMRRLAWVILLALLNPVAGWAAANPPLQGSNSPPSQIKNSACLECHSDKTLSKTNAAGDVLSLFIDEPRFLAAVLKTNTCATCHSDLTVKHPDDNIPAKPVNCARCHEKQAGEYAASIHGVSHTLGASGAASCIDCHSLDHTNTALNSHYIGPVKSADSPVFKLNLPGTCAK